MKILIVDDSATARMVLRKAIPDAYSPVIQEAVDGRDGLEKFRSFLPDLTFLDLTMPVMDGFEALEILHREFPRSLIAILSADIQKQAFSRAADLGAWRFLKKPPTSAEVGTVLADAAAALEAKQQNGL